MLSHKNRCRGERDESWYRRIASLTPQTQIVQLRALTTYTVQHSTMASRSLTTPLRTCAYVCDSCLGGTKALRSAQVAAIRPFGTASSQKQKTSTQVRRRLLKDPPRALLSAQSRGQTLPSCAPARSYTTERDSIEAGIAPLPHRRLLSLSGPDAAKFLQGLVTNNVDSTRLSPFYSAFLDARGRVLWDVFIWVWPEMVAEKGHWSCYIEVDENEVEALKKHLKKHKLRSKIEVKDVATEGADGIRVWAAWGGAHEKVSSWSDAAGFKDPRVEEGMYRYLANADRNTIADNLQPVDTKYYHSQRYLQGVAEGPHEIPRESALPMEYNFDISGGIDFKKGCYVGQELTIRTKHTGVVRKRVLPIQLHTLSEGGIESSNGNCLIRLPTPGADIKTLDEDGILKKGRATGKFVAGIGNVGLALCRLENMTSMRVSAEGGTYKEGMQFGMEAGEEMVKVVPVLHAWFVKRKEILWDRKASARVLDEE
jgi:folate-binding protein YgfZ